MIAVSMPAGTVQAADGLKLCWIASARTAEKDPMPPRTARAVPAIAVPAARTTWPLVNRCLRISLARGSPSALRLSTLELVPTAPHVAGAPKPLQQTAEKDVCRGTRFACRGCTGGAASDHPLVMEPLLTLEDLRELFGLSEAKIRAVIRRLDFPSAIYLSARQRRWPLADVLDFRDRFIDEPKPTSTRVRRIPPSPAGLRIEGSAQRRGTRRRAMPLTNHSTTCPDGPATNEAL